MKHLFSDRLIAITAGLFVALTYLPLLLLSTHNHPSAADDYCFADTAVRYGFWAAQKLYYNGWTGRYFSNMLVHGSPLVWGWYDGYRLIPALTVTGFLLAIYSFTNELLRDHSRVTRLTATGLLFFTYMVALPNTVEGFFWTSAVVAYTIPAALTLYWLAIVMRWYRLPTGLYRNLNAFWAGVLVFFIVGSGETILVLLVGMILAMAGYRLVFQRTFDGFLAAMLVVALASAGLVFGAPGNAIRLGSNEIEGNIVVSLGMTVGILAKAVLIWLVQTPMLPLSLLSLPLLVRLNRADSSVRTIVQLPVLLLTLIWAGVLLVLTFPSVYGLGTAPGRVMNLTYLVFLFGWFLVLTAWVGYLMRGQGTVGRWLNAGAPVPTLAQGVAGLWLIGSIVVSPTLKLQYGDLLSGDAATYDREMSQRHAQLQQSGDTLQLAPISVYPATLVVEDIKTDSQHWWNRCQAGYYHHKTVLLTAGHQ